MIKKFYINSRYYDYNNAKIHVEDRGLQFGDSIYEVVAFYNKKLIDLNFHFERLRYSLAQLHIKYNFDDKKITKIFNKLIKINSFKNGILYLQITRGVQSRNHGYKDKLKPTLIIYAKNKNFNLPNKNYQGVAVITHDDLRWSRRDIKTTNLLPNILAEKYAKRMNAYTAILIKKNRITEGVSSNIWIIKNKNILTHVSNNDILRGITRTVLKSIIENSEYKLKENSFTLKQLYNADEVFLTSSSNFITPILKVDDKLINKGNIGNITLSLAKSYFKTFK